VTSVGVLGATGFVGTAVTGGLVRRGVHVVRISAPRLSTKARTLDALLADVSEVPAWVRTRLLACDVVVNAAGLADAGAADGDALYGANALLPLMLARTISLGGRPHRLVHVSSAAVQGRRSCLDESTTVAPFSPYTTSKALAERAVLGFEGVTVFRPTSVHGEGREVTRRLARFVASAMASVAGDGTRPTPQVLVENVGDAIAHVVVSQRQPPRVILQPSDSLTTADLIRLLGSREPKHVPEPLARAIVSGLAGSGRVSGRLAASARRLEMLWFGQDQVPGWLTSSGWRPVVGLECWRQLR